MTTLARPGLLNRLGSMFARRHSVGGADILRADGTVEPLRSLYANTGGFASELMAGLSRSYNYSDQTVANAFAASVTAWACANMRAKGIANIPLMITDVNDQEMENSPADWFITKQTRFMSRLSFHISIFGKFYLRKRRNQQGLPREVELLNPLDVTANLDANGKATSYYVIGRREPVRPCDMITDTTFNPLSDVDGVSAYEVAMRQIFADAQLIRYAGGFFANGARIDGILAYEGEMDDDTWKVQNARLKEFKGASNAFKIFLTGGLFKWIWTPLTHAPADLAMPDLKNLLRSDTCAAFAVNPVLIGIGTANDPLSAEGTYEQIEQRFIQSEMIPESKFICAALNDQWIEKDFKGWGDLKIEPNLKDFQALTSATGEKSTTAVANVAGGIWGVNEARRHTGQDPWQGHIERDPGRALALWQAGVIRRSRVQVAIGEQPDTMADGYIYEVDPRAKAPPPQPMAFSFQPHQPPPALPPGGSEPGRSEPPVDNPNEITVEVLRGEPMRTDPLLTKAQLYELDNWAKKVKHKGVSASFEPSHLPDPLARFVRANLADGWNSAAVFAEAKASIRAGVDPKPIGATEDEAGEYWRGYDELMDSLRWIEELKYNPSQDRDPGGKWTDGGGSGGGSGKKPSGGKKPPETKKPDSIDEKLKKKFMELTPEQQQKVIADITGKKPPSGIAPKPSTPAPKPADNKPSAADAPETPGSPDADVKGYFNYDENDKNTVIQSVAMSKTAVSKLDASAKQSVNAYSDTAYIPINNCLRSSCNDLDVKNQTHIQQLDKAIGSSALPQDTVLYRGFGFAPKGLSKLKVGATFSDKGYVSTSLNRSIAESFTKGGAKGSVVMRIKAKKGTKALPVSAISEYQKEHEVLLPRGSNFRVTGVTKKNGVTYVDAEVAA